MDTTKRQTADRIRPILAAMERSIDSARRRRLHIVDDRSQSANVIPHPAGSATQSPVATNQARPIDTRDELIAAPASSSTRDAGKNRDADSTPSPGKATLKARPKRPVGFTSNGDRPFYGAKAG